MSDETPSIRIRHDGPYLVKGADLLRLKYVRNEDGRPVSWLEKGAIDADATYALCRCGASARKPFCDGSHRDIAFDGEETASLASTDDDRESFGGDRTHLTDDKSLCWHAGFCVREGTSAWKLSNRESLDAEQRDLLGRMVHSCPSGRIELHAAPGTESDEPELERRIGVIDDGPLYVQGGIPLQSARGDTYQVRNRVSLCRCGASGNKPFCDGSHVDAGFEDS